MQIVSRELFVWPQCIVDMSIDPRGLLFSLQFYLINANVVLDLQYIFLVSISEVVATSWFFILDKIAYHDHAGDFFLLNHSFEVLLSTLKWALGYYYLFLLAKRYKISVDVALFLTLFSRQFYSTMLVFISRALQMDCSGQRFLLFYKMSFILNLALCFLVQVNALMRSNYD